MSRGHLPGAPKWMVDATPSTWWLLLPLACVGLGVVGLVLIALFPEQALSIFGVGR